MRRSGSRNAASEFPCRSVARACAAGIICALLMFVTACSTGSKNVARKAPPAGASRAQQEAKVAEAGTRQSPLQSAQTDGAGPRPTPGARASRSRAPAVSARRPDGVAAPNCVASRRTHSAGTNAAEISVKNNCSYAIDTRGVCLPSYVEEDEPFPGTYSLDSRLFTLEAGEAQRELDAEVCAKRGGKVLYASCRVGVPYFTAPDASKFGCYK